MTPVHVTFFQGTLGNRPDFRGLRPLRILDRLELDRLTFGQRAIAFRYDLAVVAEQVLAAGIRCDEPEALLIVEPLHFARFHLLLLNVLTALLVPYRTSTLADQTQGFLVMQPNFTDPSGYAPPTLP